MTPTSPAETADTSKATARPWKTWEPSVGYVYDERDHVVAQCWPIGASPWEREEHRANANLIVEAVNAYDALRAAACKDPTLHAVADAPLRPLSDLLRTATEFDEIAGFMLSDHADFTDIERDVITALRAAVRALQGPPAPFRPQQAHAAPAKGGQS